MQSQLLLLADQVNEFVKRVRAAKIHILIMGHLRKKMPAMMGKQKAQEKLLANLQTEFGMVQREYHLPAGKTPAVLFAAATRHLVYFSGSAAEIINARVSSSSHHDS